MAGRPRKRGLAPPLPPAGVKSYGPSKHDSNCKCPRCIGFQPGNTYRPETPNLKHGARAGSGAGLAKISAEASVIADCIREVMPIYHEADELALRALSIVLVRIERAEAALAARDRGETLPDGRAPVEGDTLEKHLRSWLTTAERYFSALGLTPASRARLGLDIARARSYTVLDLYQEAAEEALPPAVDE